MHGAKLWWASDGAPKTDLHPLAPARAYAEVLPDACLQLAGDVLYLPAGWSHTTLNVGETVAVGEQHAWPARERLEASLGRAPTAEEVEASREGEMRVRLAASLGREPSADEVEAARELAVQQRLRGALGRPPTLVEQEAARDH